MMRALLLLLILLPLVVAFVVGWVVESTGGVALRARTVTPTQRRIAELTAQAKADRDRCQAILRVNALEAEAGIPLSDFGAELRDISDRTTVLEAELKRIEADDS